MSWKELFFNVFIVLAIAGLLFGIGSCDYNKSKMIDTQITACRNHCLAAEETHYRHYRYSSINSCYCGAEALVKEKLPNS